MKKIYKIIGIILTCIILLIAIVLLKVEYDFKIQEIDQENMIKSDSELIGAHLYIDRDNKEAVDVNWYEPQSNDKLPLVINLHGGAFIAGDADTLDTQSDRISKDWLVNVATVNYKLLGKNINKQYVIDEITDTVKYFIEHSDKYNVDVENIYIMGYSAGGYYAMASSLDLVKEGVGVRGQILCYAFIGDIVEQFNTLSEQQKNNVPDTLFILAGDEPISKGSLDYKTVLSENGIPTSVKVYDDVKHGFIEENNPEYEILHKKNKTSKNQESEAVARQAEQYINEWMLRIK